MNHSIPLLRAIQTHIRYNPLPMHVPGHKMGRGLPEELAAWLGQAGKLDLTELPGLDDLHQAEGPIREAQQLAAKAFGSEETFFLVGGSTAGNLAMISAVCKPGDTIIIPRHAHKSVHHAVLLAGAKPQYIYPEYDAEFGIPTVVTPAEVERALQEFPEAKAVLITNPSYQGIGSPVQTIAQIVHQHGKVLLVDEAHGAHFTFHTQLPMSAIEAGADLVVQSTHKMLGSLTGSAMLHGQGNRYDTERLRMMLAMIQTSSPSYLMLLSLDVTRYLFAKNGFEVLDQAMEAIEQGKKLLRTIPELKLYEAGISGLQVDPFKWWVQVSGLGMTGYEAERLFREQKGIFAEMADVRHLLAVFSYADTEKQVLRLVEGFRFLAETKKPFSPLPPAMDYSRLRLEQALLPKDALHSSRRNVKLEVAVGQVAFESVIPYPPGIPVVLPGERYSQEVVDCLLQARQNGARFHGTADPSLEYVRVIE